MTELELKCDPYSISEVRLAILVPPGQLEFELVGDAPLTAEVASPASGTAAAAVELAPEHTRHCPFT